MAFLNRIVACGLVVLGVGCGQGFAKRDTQILWDPKSTDFWARPFPSDLRQQEDGTYDLDDWPGDWRNLYISNWLRAVDDRLRDGWGLTTGVFVALDGPVDPETLPPTAAASMEDGASVFLVDVDPDSPERGRRLPVDVEQLTEADPYTPENLLAAIPVFGFVRRPSTTYALVITEEVRDASGKAIGRSHAFHRAWSGNGPDLAVSNLQLVRDLLTEEGRDVDGVVGAAVFTTMDPNETLLRLAQWTENLPAPEVTSPWELGPTYESHQVLFARTEVPVIQSGFRPYNTYGEGRIEWGEDGLPVVQSTQSVRLALTVPRSPMPADGFPLMMYSHGSGGEFMEAIDRGPRQEVPMAPLPPPGTGPAEWLARRGVATLAYDFPLHGDRHNPPDTSGLLLYNLLGNPDATVGNFHVAVMELLRHSRLVTEMSLDASLSPELDAGGALDDRIRFDPDRLSAFGHSMGAYLSIPWATVDPRVKGFVFSGSGSMLVEIAVSALEPFVLKPAVELVTDLSEEPRGIHRAHPMLHAMQNMWDMIEPVVKARHVALEPHPGFGSRHILMGAGFRDGYFHPYAQAANALGLGVPLAGDAAEPVLAERLALDGRETAQFPVQGNVGGKTLALTSYEAPNTLGHYVYFNQEGAQHQYTCYVASIGTPGGAIVGAPATWDSPCP